MAVKLHGHGFSLNTVRALAALNEKGVDFELVTINLHTGEHKQQPFISLNPFGLVPALEDGDVTLFESRAITKYVASKYKDEGPADLLRSDNLKESALVNVWVEVEAQHFHPVVAPLVSELIKKPLLMGIPSDPEVVKDLSEKLEKVLDIYEERLSKSKYLVGDFYTLADLHHLPYTSSLMTTEKASLVKSRPHVSAWWEDICARPAWLKTAERMKF